MTVNLHTPLTRFPGPPADTEAEQVELLLRAVEAEIHAGGWGQLPIFGSVWRHRPGTVDWTTQVVPPLTLALSPADVLERLAGRVEASWLQPILRSAAATTPVQVRFVAYCLVAEQWGLIYDLKNPDPAKRAEYERAHAEHTIAAHPDRRQCRIVWAAFGDGRTVAVGRVRGESPEYTDGTRGPIRGRVADSLRRIAAVFAHAESAGRS